MSQAKVRAKASKTGMQASARSKPRVWAAQWIGRRHMMFKYAGQSMPAPLYRKEFTLNGAVRHATLHICGLGFYVARINGRRVGDRVLDPSASQYDRRVRYVTYDVTDMLRAGVNAIGVTLGSGWYNGHTVEFWNLDRAVWRDYPKLILELEVRLESGKKFRLASDGSWRVAEGPILFDGLRNGEHYDARAERPGWDKPGYDDGAWEQAAIVPGPGGVLEPQLAPPCRVMKTLTPVSLRKLESGAVIYDMGQNMAGWALLRVSGPAGTQITLRYAERLNAEGDLDIAGMDRFIESGEFQTDRYTLKGQGDELWEPGFTYHGFQYVRVEGLPGKPSLDTIRGRVVHTSFDEVGGVATSSETLNRLQDCARWAYVGNFVGFPTDCPHREKNGWTGDAHLAAETGLLNFGAGAAYGEWLDSIADCQRPSGQVPAIVPCAGWGYNWGSGPAWDSALILIPWYIYLYTGDRSHIDRLYPAMARYVHYLGTLATHHIVHFGLGDWCAVDGSRMAPSALTSTAYYYVDTCLLARFATLTGRNQEAAAFEALAVRIRRAFNAAFYHGDGRYADGQMTALACAVYQGLVEDDQRPAVVARLVEAVEANDGKVDFGILGAKYVPRVLAENGHAELALRLFTQPAFPGWAHWLQDGATTLRENWNNSDSQNHIMFGDISACLYSYFAGIVPDPMRPGFKHVTLRPHLVDGLDWVKAWHRAPAGIIRSAWKRAGRKVTFDVTLPEGTRGALVLPDGSRATLDSGSRRVTWPL
ncbi:MAG: alpha-rhamnosidase [Lentisphaerae bacterium]|nr:alpha-rhamnosidase [Lentisphaerota bacterium]